jgi:hypothetical protein
MKAQRGKVSHMYPKNFPGRKNERRRTALKLLSGSRNTKAARLGREPGFDRKEEMRHLAEDLIMPVDTARSIRTKINRASRGRLRP